MRRPQVPSKRYAFLSIFKLHNETMNIWTHLVGFLIFVWFTVLFAANIGCVGAGGGITGVVRARVDGWSVCACGRVDVWCGDACVAPASWGVKKSCER